MAEATLTDSKAVAQRNVQKWHAVLEKGVREQKELADYNPRAARRLGVLLLDIAEWCELQEEAPRGASRADELDAQYVGDVLYRLTRLAKNKENDRSKVLRTIRKIAFETALPEVRDAALETYYNLCMDDIEALI